MFGQDRQQPEHEVNLRDKNKILRDALLRADKVISDHGSRFDDWEDAVTARRDIAETLRLVDEK
jgi:hypothetical protein